MWIKYVTGENEEAVTLVWSCENISKGWSAEVGGGNRSGRKRMARRPR